MNKFDIEYEFYNHKNKHNYANAVNNFDCSLDRDRTPINRALKMSADEEATTLIFIDKTNGNIIGFCSYCCSSIKDIDVVRPAIEIKAFGVDKHYQNKPLKDHRGLTISAYIFQYCIKTIEDISRNHICARYIVLYTYKNEKNFYKKNMFNEFNAFYEKLENSNEHIEGCYMLRYIEI
jgi:hypothetical protein